MDNVTKVKNLLETYGVNDQRTDAWHMKRGEMLTASDIYKALSDATPSQRYELMISKLVPKIPTEGSGARALIWGTRFEPIAKEIYELENPGFKIVDTTCVKHPTVSYLGASPDGILITEDTAHPRYGRLVEFKCPISRVFNDSTPIPTSYFHQLQLQMECTELYECEYIEMKFLDLNYSAWNDRADTYKSWFAVHNNEKEVKYRLLNDSRDLSTWKKAELENLEEWTMVYWALDMKRVAHVQHQSDWLEKNLPSIESLWNEVMTHRQAGTLPIHPKDKVILTL